VGISEKASLYNARASPVSSLARILSPFNLLIASNISLSSAVSASILVKRLNILPDTVTCVKDSSAAYLLKNFDIASPWANTLTANITIPAVIPVVFIFIEFGCLCFFHFYINPVVQTQDFVFVVWLH